MSCGLQHDARAAGVKFGRLRSEAAEALGVETPELDRLQRVSWGNVAMAALTLFAAYSLISALTDIGFDTIVDQLSHASWRWVMVAFVLAELTNVGEYISLAGVVGSPIPFGPTIMFRYAPRSSGLRCRADAGAIAMNIRYQRKFGVPVAAAVAQGPLLTLFSKGFDIILLFLSAKFIGEALDTDELDLGQIVRWSPSWSWRRHRRDCRVRRATSPRRGASPRDSGLRRRERQRDRPARTRRESPAAC